MQKFSLTRLLHLKLSEGLQQVISKQNAIKENEQEKLVREREGEKKMN